MGKEVEEDRGKEEDMVEEGRGKEQEEGMGKEVGEDAIYVLCLAVLQ